VQNLLLTQKPTVLLEPYSFCAWIAHSAGFVFGDDVLLKLTPDSCSDLRILSHAWGLVGLKPPALSLSRPAGSASATTLARALLILLLQL
jgi:hypothetical protein